ncbi:MAG TPA: threonine--tRNA ligase [bacterium]
MLMSAIERIFVENKKLKDETVAVRVNGIITDIHAQVSDTDSVEPVYLNSPEGTEILRHSTAHVMAQAVKELFHEAKVTIGPAIEDGFYYDFYYPKGFSPDDLSKIENKMKEIIKNGHLFKRMVMSRADAINFFTKTGEDYKIEIIKELNEQSISLYEQGGFVDLCRGPHLPSTKLIKHFKLQHIAGAYWRGDEKREMLQRIYGTAFPEKEQLDSYLQRIEEAKKRDHRKLGRDLDLFSIEESTGAGLILWHPRGAIIRKVIEDFWKDEHLKNGYNIVYTPHIAKLDIWKTSGHTEFYRENMYAPIDIDNVEFQLKPMNCPFHIQIYKSKIRSYRDLPIRLAELGTVYRYERAGVLHGLLRVRGFTQDDAHIFTSIELMGEEIVRVIELTTKILRTFGFSEYQVFLSTRPEKFVGAAENWEKATAALKNSLEKMNIEYSIDPGEGVFYGPKIDIKIKDILGRQWQCSTVQVDFNLPEKFEVDYIDKDNKKHRTVMIHRALMGSLERFFGILIEHYAGAFPLWLSPVQVAVLSISEKFEEYARTVSEQLRQDGVRVEDFFGNAKLGYKVREAEIMKVPYIVVVGKNEEETKTISVRKRGKNIDNRDINIIEFISQVKKENEFKK